MTKSRFESRIGLPIGTRGDNSPSREKCEATQIREILHARLDFCPQREMLVGTCKSARSFEVMRWSRRGCTLHATATLLQWRREAAIQTRSMNTPSWMNLDSSEEWL